MSRLEDARRYVDDADMMAGTEPETEQALYYASAIAHALIALVERLDVITTPGVTTDGNKAINVLVADM